MGVSCLSDFVRHFGVEARGRRGEVIHRQGTMPVPGDASLEFHYKQYEYPGGSWKFLARASKARCEYWNSLSMAGMGVACPEVVACGEERDGLHRLRRAFILMRKIPDAKTLAEFSAAHCSDLRTSRPLRLELIRQLTALTRRVHEHGFIHHDLFVRNVLVHLDGSQKPKVWLIDSPRGSVVRWGPWRRSRGRIKDLASLARGAVAFSTRTERLRFLHQYLGKDKLGPAIRQMVRRIMAYARRRWGESAVHAHPPAAIQSTL